MMRTAAFLCLLLLAGGAAAQTAAPAPERDLTAGLETCLLTPEALAK